MERFFNTAGPCNKSMHYMIDPSTRLTGIQQLINRKQYFSIYAARQSGKTTCLNDLMERLNEEGKYYTLYCSLEGLQGMDNPREGIPEIVRKIRNLLCRTTIPLREEFAKNADYENFTDVLNYELSLFCEKLDKPFILLFDEVDCLTELTLISFLRQLRDGHNSRERIPFVHSVVLVGMRNIRDYKARIRPDCDSLGSSSPFNIVAETMTLKNFTKEEITTLYHQHTADTGQIFEPEAIEFVFEQSQGQPWLVNAIVREVIDKMLMADYTQSVTAPLVFEAIQTIILRRDTHIDSLLERLKEERVRRVIEPMLYGEHFEGRTTDDYLYVINLGLIKNVRSEIQPANPIYGEIIARELSHDAQDILMTEAPEANIPRYLQEGRIDMDYLMRDFQQFWRENSDVWVEKFHYKEAAPHLILQAFLQRVINGGGHIIREMGAGKGRTDLCLVYEKHHYPIELKILRGEKSIAQGLEQTLRYMDVFGCTEGWLAVFDRRPTVAWEEKIYVQKETVNGKTVTLIGL